MNEKNCIYCGEPFDPSRGAGDHILPSALFGEFYGDARFRGCCPACNNSFSTFEQILAQATPLGHLRRYVPIRRRGRAPGTRQRGAKGSKAPQFTVRSLGYDQLAKPMDDPSKVEPVDQVTLIDQEGSEHHIELFKGITAMDLKARKEELGIEEVTSVFCSIAEQTEAEFRSLLREVFPDLIYKELPDTEPGESTTIGGITFEYSIEADRAIAKIAFHYYLTYNLRGFDGSEPEFAALREYLLHGGDGELFFDQTGPEFVLPFGEDDSGRVQLPSNWCHVLLVHEVAKQIVAYMRLFAGPEHVGEEYHVTLGYLEDKIVLPSGSWGHIYRYDESRENNFSGFVEAVHPERLGARQGR